MDRAAAEPHVEVCVLNWCILGSQCSTAHFSLSLLPMLCSFMLSPLY